MSKISQSNEDLEKQLQEQLDLLIELTKLYDNGKKVAAKSMATTIRVLLHDTQKSKSLLGQLNRKNVKYYDTAETRKDRINGGVRAGSFSAFLSIAMGGGEGFIPNLDDSKSRRVGFDSYWNEEIFYDENKNSFTRKEIVLYVANQDGGSHVDPGLDKKYAELSRQNSLGWHSSPDGKNWKDMDGAELASIRQIAHELLKTFLLDYKTPEIKRQGIIIGGGGITLMYDEGDKFKEARRKDPCPCGSGKKFKRCHGT